MRNWICLIGLLLLVAGCGGSAPNPYRKLELGAVSMALPVPPTWGERAMPPEPGRTTAVYESPSSTSILTVTLLVTSDYTATRSASPCAPFEPDMPNSDRQYDSAGSLWEHCSYTYVGVRGEEDAQTTLVWRQAAGVVVEIDFRGPEQDVYEYAKSNVVFYTSP